MSEKYHMHLHDREITERSTLHEIIRNGKYAVIAMCRNNEPYLVTLNYGFDPDGEALYFHSAPSGLKLEILKENPAVCATIIHDKGYLDGKCAHAYRSLVLHGTMSIVADLEEKKQGMRTMLYQLEANAKSMEERLLAREKFLSQTVMLKLTIKQMRGKEGQ